MRMSQVRKGGRVVSAERITHSKPKGPQWCPVPGKGVWWCEDRTGHCSVRRPAGMRLWRAAQVTVRSSWEVTGSYQSVYKER